MRGLSFIILASLTLASCASQQRGSRYNGPALFAKNPSVILALDIAQSRAAQEDGVWKAMEDTASDNAITFVPEPVVAKEWLAKQKTALNSKWKPHSVYMSCDGRTGVTTGEIKWGDINGYYTTVWQYFEKSSGKGKWRWLLSHGDGVDTPRKAPEFLQTKAASCKGRAPAQLFAPSVGVQMKQGLSRDQSLSYTWRYKADGSRSLEVKLWNGEGFDVVLMDKVKPAK